MLRSPPSATPPSPAPGACGGRQSAEQRLAMLGRVFSVEQFQNEQGLSAKAISVYLARWQAQGLIGRLGPRCGLWVNFTQPGGAAIAWADRAVAVAAKHPGAVVGGRSALAAHGWVDDLAGPVRLLVPQGQSRAQLDGVELVFRSPPVHALLAGLARPHRRMLLPVLPAEAVVADWLAREQDVPLALRRRAGDQAALVRRLAQARA